MHDHIIQSSLYLSRHTLDKKARCRAKTSLVEKQIAQSQRGDRETASSTLAEPTVFTHIVVTELLITGAILATAAQWMSAPHIAWHTG